MPKILIIFIHQQQKNKKTDGHFCLVFVHTYPALCFLIKSFICLRENVFPLESKCSERLNKAGPFGKKSR